jgi:hypothetical protein
MSSFLLDQTPLAQLYQKVYRSWNGDTSLGVQKLFINPIESFNTYITYISIVYYKATKETKGNPTK